MHRTEPLTRLEKRRLWGFAYRYRYSDLLKGFSELEKGRLLFIRWLVAVGQLTAGASE